MERRGSAQGLRKRGAFRAVSDPVATLERVCFLEWRVEQLTCGLEDKERLLQQQRVQLAESAQREAEASARVSELERLLADVRREAVLLGDRRDIQADLEERFGDSERANVQAARLARALERERERASSTQRALEFARERIAILESGRERFFAKLIAWQRMGQGQEGADLAQFIAELRAEVSRLSSENSALTDREAHLLRELQWLRDRGVELAEPESASDLVDPVTRAAPPWSARTDVPARADSPLRTDSPARATGLMRAASLERTDAPIRGDSPVRTHALMPTDAPVRSDTQARADAQGPASDRGATDARFAAPAGNPTRGERGVGTPTELPAAARPFGIPLRPSRSEAPQPGSPEPAPFRSDELPVEARGADLVVDSVAGAAAQRVPDRDRIVGSEGIPVAGAPLATDSRNSSEAGKRSEPVSAREVSVGAPSQAVSLASAMAPVPVPDDVEQAFAWANESGLVARDPATASPAPLGATTTSAEAAEFERPSSSFGARGVVSEASHSTHSRELSELLGEPDRCEPEIELAKDAPLSFSEVRHQLRTSMGTASRARNAERLLLELFGANAALRRGAARALVHLAGEFAAPSLSLAFHAGTEAEERVELLGLMARTGAPQVGPAIRAAQEDKEPKVRAAALDALSQHLRCDGDGLRAPLEKALADRDARVRRRAVMVLCSLPRAEAAGLLSRVLEDPDPQLRRAACAGLSQVSSPGIQRLLAGVLLDPEPVVRRAAASALQATFGPEVLRIAEASESERRRQVASLRERIAKRETHGEDDPEESRAQRWADVLARSRRVLERGGRLAGTSRPAVVAAGLPRGSQ